MIEKQSPRDIMATFLAEVMAGKHGDDAPLEAILLEHLLLQAGFKVVSRIPDERVMQAGLLGNDPTEIWHEMWDAAGIDAADDNEGYTPA